MTDYKLQLQILNNIGIALSQEENHDALLEIILKGAKRLTHADAGSIYIKTDQDSLQFSNVLNDSLNIELGGTSGNEIHFPEIPLKNEHDQPNLNNVVSAAINKNIVINIDDAYKNKDYDFSGTIKFDKQTGYRSKSFLTVPLLDHRKEIIGALQLINRVDEKFPSKVIAFTEQDLEFTKSLASQAAIILTKQSLLNAQKVLFEDFIALIAKAIDEKSPYTGGHCARVPEISLMIANAINQDNTGPYQDFRFNKEEMYELKIAAWLHDCGKVTTPEYVVDKSTKLETIFDRIEHVELRLELFKKEQQVAMLKQRLKDKLDKEQFEMELTNLNKAVNQDLDFLRKTNIGGEFLEQADKERLDKINHSYPWSKSDQNSPTLLTEQELSNLKIERGTLNKEERATICNHVTVTLKMLQSLTYPPGLENVPEIAASHHERLDGKGYPRGLTAEQLSLQARIVAIADIFEALTASDRPYKSAKPMSEVLAILTRMAQQGHIDADIYQVFLDQKLYKKYGKKYLSKEQMNS